MVKEKQK